jgi:hypothetical protein
MVRRAEFPAIVLLCWQPANRARTAAPLVVNSLRITPSLAERIELFVHAVADEQEYVVMLNKALFVCLWAGNLIEKS